MLISLDKYSILNYLTLYWLIEKDSLTKIWQHGRNISMQSQTTMGIDWEPESCLELGEPKRGVKNTILSRKPQIQLGIFFSYIEHFK